MAIRRPQPLLGYYRLGAIDREAGDHLLDRPPQNVLREVLAEAVFFACVPLLWRASTRSEYDERMPVSGSSAPINSAGQLLSNSL
jgi:hypothetical protein